MDGLALERAQAQVRRVRFEIERNQRDYQSAVAFASFIGGYPRSYVAECWRNRSRLAEWVRESTTGGMF